MRMSEVGMLASSPMLLLLLSLIMASFFDTTAGQVGVCYGEKGNNLPSNSEVVDMYKKYKIRRMRMYDVNPNALNALRGSGIELILDIPNHKIDDIANKPMEATKWVRENVEMYKDVRFRYISVGNELKPEDLVGKETILIQAIRNIDKALSEARLSIPVSTTTYMGAFTDTYPPSRGRFNATYLNFLQPVIDFLVSKRSPLLVNIYTFFGYNDSKGKIPLEYALFTQTSGGERDSGYTYLNLFDANLDSVYAALEKSGGQSLEIVVSETGWPTKGGLDANKENAEIYINNLIKHVKNGSPRKQGKAIETYIFAMFNENDKGPQEYERYWGLFFPDKKPQIEVTNGFN
ncbi:hypothetical protein IGI04_014362 [Brassica rapa subsp. trilocularis]|uniref:glucan endo-1,3-beta-D-glucosidase n=1 Tax=Brassica rapa subsp. trilocularis TaxID=1813537 RepID=A0ABQ7MMQ1_BRACM|nr:hypothetical protein IGI04_014362 [Brassica rapa subsp. trilocularis]